MPQSRLRGSADRSWPSGGTTFPAVASPALSEESTHDDVHLREGHPEVHHLSPPLRAPHQLFVGVVPGASPLDGLITKDKFCMTRHGRLSLSWSRRRATVTQSLTNRTASGPAYPPAGITQHGGIYETPVARTSGSDGASGRPPTLGQGLPVHPAVESRNRSTLRSEREW